LRDGTTATIRVAQPIDKEAMAKFFASLSQESNIHRFFSGSRPNDRLIESFCDNADPRARLTLVVTRLMEKNLDIIAACSYMARDQTTAEIAMAVGDRFQGKGIGTLLLERLALVAVMNGFTHFSAVTMAENSAMLQVFRDSGFKFQSNTKDGYVDVDLSVIPSETSVTRAEMRDRVSTAASLRPFFHPQSVAVVGASRNPANIGNSHGRTSSFFSFGSFCHAPLNDVSLTLALRASNRW
jgi:acetate---CoA ligase (ADP-forming)